MVRYKTQFLIVTLLFISIQAVGEDLLSKKLLKEIFPESSKIAVCKTLKPVASQKYDFLGPEASSALEKLLQNLRSENIEQLQKLFHPRLKIKKSDINGVISSIWASYGKKSSINIYKIMAVTNPEDQPELIPCQNETYAIRAQFGYPIQLAGLIQITGKKEIGYLFVSLVPYNNSFVIGAFHSWQWTHLHKDHQAWVEEAHKDFAEKRPELAWVKIDIARKLLDGKPYFQDEKLQEYSNIAKDLLKQEQVFTDIKTALLPKKIEYIGTSLTTQGISLLIRSRLEKELSTNQLRAFCQESFEALNAKFPSLKELNGLYCGFLAPSEQDFTRDGAWGGFLYSPTAKTSGT
ncbi:MAG: hypothetical protein KBD78_12555 [Oligoflexales bacterium]|nr:hypothetical protein [Oligoflexales bacterium]